MDSVLNVLSGNDLRGLAGSHSFQICHRYLRLVSFALTCFPTVPRVRTNTRSLFVHSFPFVDLRWLQCERPTPRYARAQESQRPNTCMAQDTDPKNGWREPFGGVRGWGLGGSGVWRAWKENKRKQTKHTICFQLSDPTNTKQQECDKKQKTQPKHKTFDNC